MQGRQLVENWAASMKNSWGRWPEPGEYLKEVLISTWLVSVSRWLSSDHSLILWGEVFLGTSSSEIIVWCC